MRAHRLYLVLFGWIAAGPAQAQSLREWKPIVQAGPSVNLVDIEEPDAGWGGGLRLGVRWRPLVVAAVLHRWGDIFGAPMTSAGVEITYPGSSRGGLSAALVASFGHAWWSHPRAPDWDGGKSTGAVGVGILARASADVELRFDALMRSDGEGYNTEFRLMGGWAPELPEAESRPGARFGLWSHWMWAASGPWRFVEPAFGIRFSRPEVGPWGGAFRLGVIHWQIPGRVQFRDYLWDTRAFLAEPGLEWRAPGEGVPFRFAAGPSLVIMGEGPGNGPSLGAHARASLHLGRRPSIAATAGWFWMESDNLGSTRFTDHDVHGLTLGLQLEF